MHESKQHKETTSRVMQQLDGKGAQQFRMKDNRKSNISLFFNRYNPLQRQAFTYKKPLTGKKIIGNFFHAHLGFDDYHTLNHPVHVYQPNEESRQSNALLTNTVKDVGFGLADGLSPKVITGGDGELFTYHNGIEGAGGTKEIKISNTKEEDNLLVDAINYIGPNRKYFIGGYNCQSWLADVIRDFNRRKKESLSSTGTRPVPKIWRENPISIYTPLLASYYGASYRWGEKQSGLEFL